MKILIILMLLLFIDFNLQAQQVFASSGKDVNNSNIKISYTIGEPLVSKMSNSTISLSNGFQNSTNLIITGLSDNFILQHDFLVFPNPVKSILVIENRSNRSNLSYKMYTFAGKEVVISNFNNQYQQLIDMNNIPVGLYVLEIVDNITQEIQTYKIE